jgi:hypothetical protein
MLADVNLDGSGCWFVGWFAIGACADLRSPDLAALATGQVSPCCILYPSLDGSVGQHRKPGKPKLRFHLQDFRLRTGDWPTPFRYALVRCAPRFAALDFVPFGQLMQASPVALSDFQPSSGQICLLAPRVSYRKRLGCTVLKALLLLVSFSRPRPFLRSPLARLRLSALQRVGDEGLLSPTMLGEMDTG